MQGKPFAVYITSRMLHSGSSSEWFESKEKALTYGNALAQRGIKVAYNFTSEVTPALPAGLRDGLTADEQREIGAEQSEAHAQERSFTGISKERADLLEGGSR